MGSLLVFQTHKSWCFFARFQKNSRLWRQLYNIEKKLIFLLTKTSRILSKGLCIFILFGKCSKKLAIFVEFSYKPKIFQNISGIRKKNLKVFSKKLKDLKKTQSFGGNVPQNASQKAGQKPPCHK